MDPRILEGALIVAPVAAWFGLFGLARVATRPRAPHAAPATEELGSESPAVVSLLVNHWEITEDAAESTLIDLAARKILEFRQPANDPRQTTVHIRQSDPAGLTAYEKRVFDRVSGLAANGVVPLTALTFRDKGAAKSWGKRLAAEVIAEARGKGLSRRRFGAPVLTMLSGAAAAAALCVAVGVFLYLRTTHDHSSHDPTLGAGFFTFVALSAIAAKTNGERDTAAGRGVASRWLGVRAWLQGHEAFGDQPPASVAIWDRYLSYGAAVGATRVSSAVIDLGMGNRRRVWSSYGGPSGPSAWHRVRVHYPRFWPRYGKTAPRLLLRGSIIGAVGYVLLRLWYDIIDTAGSALPGSAKDGGTLVSSITLIKGAGVLAGLALMLLGAYIIIRTLIDLIAPATVTGEVVWTELWRSGGDRPSTYYLAVDDASSDATRAWALPQAQMSGFGDCDVVSIRARPWSRRVTEAVLVKRGAESILAQSDDGPPAQSTEDLISQAMGMGMPSQRGDHTAGQLPGFLAGLVAPLTPAGPLASPEEVSAALGMPVTMRARSDRGPVEVTEYLAADGKRALTVMRSGGAVARLAMRTRGRGEAVTGLGDEAFTGSGGVTVRRGGEVVVIALGDAARSTPPAQILDLARTCVSRLPVATS